MSQRKNSQLSAKKATRRSPTRLGRPGKPEASVSPGRRSKAGSKQAQVLAMLGAPEGVGIAAIMQATGWQQHSVRGFLAGVVRKKLQRVLTSAVVDGERIYRIAGTSPAATAP